MRGRGGREEETTAAVCILAATDPANPYGGVLPWPNSPSAGIRRNVRLARGFSSATDDAWHSPQNRWNNCPISATGAIQSSKAIQQIANSLANYLAETPLYIKQVNGCAVQESELADALRRAGFKSYTQGFLRPVRQ